VLNAQFRKQSQSLPVDRSVQHLHKAYLVGLQIRFGRANKEELFFTSEYVIPHGGATKVYMKVRKRSLSAHQTVLLNLKSSNKNGTRQRRMIRIKAQVQTVSNTHTHTHKLYLRESNRIAIGYTHSLQRCRPR